MRTPSDEEGPLSCRGAYANEMIWTLMSLCRTVSLRPRPWPSGFRTRPRTPPSPAAPSPAFASDGTSPCREPPSMACWKRTVGHQTRGGRRPWMPLAGAAASGYFRSGSGVSWPIVSHRNAPPPAATDLGRRNWGGTLRDFGKASREAALGAGRGGAAPASQCPDLFPIRTSRPGPDPSRRCPGRAGRGWPEAHRCPLRQSDQRIVNGASRELNPASATGAVGWPPQRP